MERTTRRDPTEQRTHVPAGIGQQGTALSPTLQEALLDLVRATFEREQLRTRVTTVFAVVFTTAAGLAGLFTGASELVVAWGTTTLGAAAVLRLAWGVLNRALLDAAAAEAGIGADVLTVAVTQMKRELEPEAALCVALYGPQNPAFRAIAAG